MPDSRVIFVKSCMFAFEVKPSWKVTCMNMVPCPLVMFDEGGVVGWWGGGVWGVGVEVGVGWGGVGWGGECCSH